MKNCFACGNTQDTGNFCARCGGPLTDVTTPNDVVDQTPNPNPNPNQQPSPSLTSEQPSQPTPNFQHQGQPNYQQPPGQQQPIEQQGASFQQPPFQQHHQQQGPPFQQPPFQQQPGQQQFQQPYQQGAPAQPNVHVERVKDQSKMFFNYFKTYLKQPSSIFTTGEKQFTNGLIAIITYAIMIGISLFTFVMMFGLSRFFDGTGTIFFNVFGGSVLFILASFVIIIISLLIVAKGFGPNVSWKETVSYLGTLSIPSILIAIVSLFFFLVKSFEIGNLLFLISLMLIISAIPLFIITRLLTLKSKSIDSFYAYLLYIVIFSILFYVVITVIWNNTVGKFISTGFF